MNDTDMLDVNQTRRLEEPNPADSESAAIETNLYVEMSDLEPLGCFSEHIVTLCVVCWLRIQGNQYMCPYYSLHNLQNSCAN